MKNKKFAFTIIELLTVLAIISMLVGLLLPALTLVRNTAKQAKQRAQLTTIDNALMVWRNDFGDYPNSFLSGSSDYCGAQKLTEALLGWDLLGFEPESQLDDAQGLKYDMSGLNEVQKQIALSKRKRPYLELGTDIAFKLGRVGTMPGLFENSNPLWANTYVICDIFGIRRINLGKGKTVIAGSPILYYKANTSSKVMDPTLVSDWRQLIYNANDNLPLLALGKLTANGLPDNPPVEHPLFGGGTGEYFYNPDYKIIDQKIWLSTGGAPTGRLWPHRPDSYILISAGLDGLYGTPDDIYNF